MSLQQYGQLQEQSQTDLGVQLPTLESADLTIDSKRDHSLKRNKLLQN